METHPHVHSLKWQFEYDLVISRQQIKNVRKLCRFSFFWSQEKGMHTFAAEVCVVLLHSFFTKMEEKVQFKCFNSLCKIIYMFLYE